MNSGKYIFKHQILYSRVSTKNQVLTYDAEVKICFLMKKKFYTFLQQAKLSLYLYGL